jgi:hypothetical protein
MNLKEVYIVQDFINNEHPEFETVKECKEYILENFIDPDEGIHPDVDNMLVLKKMFYVFVDEESENEIKLMPIKDE